METNSCAEVRGIFLKNLVCVENLIRNPYTSLLTKCSKNSTVREKRCDIMDESLGARPYADLLALYIYISITIKVATDNSLNKCDITLEDWSSNILFI
jgi:hypothetical protein